jgi:hypothetical protein
MEVIRAHEGCRKCSPSACCRESRPCKDKGRDPQQV